MSGRRREDHALPFALMRDARGLIRCFLLNLLIPLQRELESGVFVQRGNQGVFGTSIA
jgi:hypothetical protein